MTFLFGIKNINSVHEVFNFCIQNIKYNIYKQRLSLRANCNEIWYKLDIEKNICENGNKQVNYGKYALVQLAEYPIDRKPTHSIYVPTHKQGVKPQIKYHFPILRHIYSYIISQNTWVYDLQETLHVFKLLCMYVYGTTYQRCRNIVLLH